MPRAVVVAGIGIGKNLLVKAVRGETDTLFDQATVERIIEAISSLRATSFVPNEADFEESTQLQIDEILFQAGVNEEQLLGDLASRGINRSPQAIAELIRQVRAPAVRAAGSAVVQGKLGFQQLKLQGQTAQNQMLNQLYQILAGLSSTSTQGPSNLGGGLADFGKFLFEFGLGEEFGLFGEKV